MVATIDVGVNSFWIAVGAAATLLYTVTDFTAEETLQVLTDFTVMAPDTNDALNLTKIDVSPWPDNNVAPAGTVHT